MKKTITTLLCLLFLFSGVSFAQDLYGANIIYTGGFKCANDGSSDYGFSWFNSTGRDIKIVRVQVWMGMSGKGLADFWYWVFIPDTMNILSHMGWDHYSDPSGVNDNRILEDYSPHSVTLKAGQELKLHCGCCNAASPMPWGDVAVTIWYY